MPTAFRVELEPVSPGSLVLANTIIYQDPKAKSSVDQLREFIVKAVNPFHNAVVISTIIQEIIALYNADQDLTSIATAVDAIWTATNSLTIASITPNSHSHLSSVAAVIFGTGFS